MLSVVHILMLAFIVSAFHIMRVVFAMLGKLCISASFAVIYVFSAELFPTVVRNVGVSAGSASARLGGIIAPYILTLVSLTFIPPSEVVLMHSALIWYFSWSCSSKTLLTALSDWDCHIIKGPDFCLCVGLCHSPSRWGN